MTVLFVNGWCRNGSTILGNILNEVPGIFHVGELHFLWKNAAGQGVNGLCGCGAALVDCPVWSVILPVGLPAGTSPGTSPGSSAGSSPGSLAPEYAAEVIRRQRAYVRTRHTWRVLGRGIDSDGLRAHAELMSRTYSAVAEQTGARILVDTTKISGEAALLPHLAGVNPYFVHLVRDPVAVASSWREPKDYVYAMSSARSTVYWQGFNLGARAVSRRYPQRSLFVRYEDFVDEPAGTIDKLLRLCGADPAANPVHGRTVELHTNHTVTGNPDRFRTGSTVIGQRSAAAVTGLPLRSRLAARTLSLPLAWRYGYATVPGRSHRSPQGGRPPGTQPGTPPGTPPVTQPGTPPMAQPVTAPREPGLEEGTVGSGA